MVIHSLCPRILEVEVMRWNLGHQKDREQEAQDPNTSNQGMMCCPCPRSLGHQKEEKKQEAQDPNSSNQGMMSYQCHRNLSHQKEKGKQEAKGLDTSNQGRMCYPCARLGQLWESASFSCQWHNIDPQNVSHRSLSSLWASRGQGLF